MKVRGKTELSFSQKKSKRKVKIFIFLIILSILIGMVSQYVLTTPYFRVKEIVVKGNNRLSSNQVLEWANIPLESSIFQVNLKEVAQRINSKSQIKKVEIKRVLPAKILILVEERLPFACLSRKEGLFEIGEDGVIIKRISNPSTLPVIKVANSSSLKKKLKIGIKILHKAEQSGLSFLEIDIKSEDILVGFLKEGVKVYLGKGEHLDYFSYLPFILEISQKEGKEIRYIDLRFNNQVIVGEK